MYVKIALSMCVVCLVATGFLVPTTASSVADGVIESINEDWNSTGSEIKSSDRDIILSGGNDDGRTLYAAPAAGANGGFASVAGEDGVERLTLDFGATTAGGEGINPMARSTFDDVFVLVNEFNESKAVGIELVYLADNSTIDIEELRNAVTFYSATDAGTEFGDSSFVEIEPESAMSVGMEFDPVGRDLAGTSIEFAFAFTIPDADAGAESVDRPTTGPNSADRTPVRTGEPANPGNPGGREFDENRELFEEPGADVESVNKDGGPPADRGSSGRGSVTSTPGADGDNGGPEISVKSSLPKLLLVGALLLPVIAIGRRRS